MSLLYKTKINVKYNVKIRKTDKNINLLFTADCGKHGTEEVLDEYDLTPLELLNILQGNPD